ncbi:zinc-binding dehydrogenase [Streptomyces spiralis]
MVTQLAREAGAYVIGAGRAADRETTLDFGAKEFVDLDNEALEDIGGVDPVFDVIGGDIGKRSAGVVRAGGMLVTIAGPPEVQPKEGLAVDFVVEADRTQLVRSSSGSGTVDCRRTSPRSRASTRPLPLSTRPNGTRAKTTIRVRPSGRGENRDPPLSRAAGERGLLRREVFR